MASISSEDTGITLHPAQPQDPDYYLPSPNQPTHVPLSTVQQVEIADLRAQIIANATILFPAWTAKGFSSVELVAPYLVMAKTPSRQQQAQRKLGQVPAEASGKQDEPASTSKQPAKSLLPNAFKFAPKEEKTKADKAKAEKSNAAQAVQAAAADLPADSHYALILRMRLENERAIPRVLLRSTPRDTKAQALEHLLELTQDMMHEAIVRHDITAAETQ